MQTSAPPPSQATPGNPTCERPACRHPLRGPRTTGHFAMGSGPCKAPGCRCPSFVGQIVRCFQGPEVRVARVIVLPATRRRA